MAGLGLRRKKIDIAVAANMNAGKGMGREALRDDLIKMVVDAFPRSHRSAAHVHLFKTHDLGELDDAKERIKDIRPEIMFILSGDGGAHRTLGDDEEFLKILMDETSPPPLIVLIGLGTMNTIPDALQLKGDYRKRVGTMLEKVQAGVPLDVIHRRILKINNKFGFIYAGGGIAVNFLEEYYKKPAPRGVRRAVSVIAGTILRPWRWSKMTRRVEAECELSDSGKPLVSESGDWSGILVSSLEQVGMGIKATYRANERVGRYHVILAKFGFKSLALNLPNMIAGRKLIGDVRDEVVTRTVLRYPGPVTHMIDGELYKKEDLGSEIVIEPGPMIPFVLS